MQKVFLVTLVCMPTFARSSVLEQDQVTNPISKVIEMLSDLQQKIIKEGEAAQKEYDEFSEWCEEGARNLQYEIKTGKASVEELQATIDQAKSDISVKEGEIEDLASTLSTDEADLKAATDIREKEHGDFVAEETDLMETVDILGRAITILEREMQKHGAASLLQSSKIQDLTSALKALVEASEISSGDASRLTALVQSNQAGKDDDAFTSAENADMGAPDPAAYKGHSSGIIDVLSDLLEKAETQLSEARKKETTSKHNFEVLKVEITDAIAFGKKQMAKAQKAKADAAEVQAVAEGDLAVTSKALAEDMQQLGSLHVDCMEKATTFEAETKSRGEELKALAEAKKVITEMTSGAAGQTYDLAQTSVSLIQILSGSEIHSRADLANFEAIRFVRELARKLGGSQALMQLANRMAMASHMSTKAGEDPFAKVKGLIMDMIDRLLKEAEAEAGHKAYCDKEMAETKQKKDDLNAEIDKMTSKIDKMSSESAMLKEQIAVLQKELADLAKSQAEMDKIRGEEHETYVANKAEMEEGLEGVKLALKILREYYAKDADHDAASGAGGGIIGMLEVIESDFSKGLAEMIAEEETALAEYEKLTKENEIAKATKEQDVKYKTKESKSLDTGVAELTSDRQGTQAELDAVLEYYSKLKDQCIAKPSTYEERKQRREAEIAGLKEALSILEGESVFIQKGQKAHSLHKLLRGVKAHVA